MSENVRVCQFFLRGRCKREKCQFRHPLEVAGSQNHAEISNNSRARSRSSDRRFVKSCSSDDAGMIDSSEDEEEMKERQLFREERAKGRRKLNPSFEEHRGVAGSRPGNNILESDRKRIKEQLEKFHAAASASKSANMKAKNQGSKQSSSNWIKVDVKCLKCGQNVENRRRKSL